MHQVFSQLKSQTIYKYVKCVIFFAFAISHTTSGKPAYQDWKKEETKALHSRIKINKI